MLNVVINTKRGSVAYFVRRILLVVALRISEMKN